MVFHFALADLMGRKANCHLTLDHSIKLGTMPTASCDCAQIFWGIKLAAGNYS
jgi:hypothetical protein